MNLKKKYKHISRMCYRGHGCTWYVRIYRSGVCHNASFADVDYYGGAAGSLRAAIAWRDEMLEKLGPPRRSKPSVAKPFGHHRKRLNTRWIARGDGWLYPVRVCEAWMKVPAGGKKFRIVATCWSVDKHGRKKASENVDAWIERTLARHGLSSPQEAR